MNAGKVSPTEAEEALRRWMKREALNDAKQVELSKLIAAFAAASIRADRTTRSLFGRVFGDQR